MFVRAVFDDIRENVLVNFDDSFDIELAVQNIRRLPVRVVRKKISLNFQIDVDDDGRVGAVVAFGEAKRRTLVVSQSNQVFKQVLSSPTR